MEKIFSIIVPARNEETLIATTIEAILESVAYFHHSKTFVPLDKTAIEVMIVDNNSSDQTAEIVEKYSQSHQVQLLHCPRLKAPCARNFGADLATGRIFIFVDADTLIPKNTLTRIFELCEDKGFEGGLTKFGSQETGLRAWCWWTFWNYVRCLPLSRAKAMCAFLFCTREAFEEFGPFDEEVVIGEEWPITAMLYRKRRNKFIYDHTLTALSSSRRMELQPFGYTKTFLKYVWAILHTSGRVYYSDRFR